MKNMTNFRVVKTEHQKPWRRKPVKCYEVFADVPDGPSNELVARFRSGKRAAAWMENVAPTAPFTAHPKGSIPWAWPWGSDADYGGVYIFTGTIDELV